MKARLGAVLLALAAVLSAPAVPTDAAVPDASLRGRSVPGESVTLGPTPDAGRTASGVTPTSTTTTAPPATTSTTAVTGSTTTTTAVAVPTTVPPVGLTPSTPTVTVTPLPGAANFSRTWNGAAFLQDNVWTDGLDQYAVWVDADRHPIVAKRRRGDSAWTSFDLTGVAGNPLAAPVGDDGHNVLTVAVDRAGYVHVVGNMHNQPLRYVRSTRPRDVTSWAAATMVGPDETSVTYPTFVRRADGGLLFFYRDGVSGAGDVVVNLLTPNATTWTRVHRLVAGRPSDESPYLHHVAVDRRTGAIHIAFVFRATADEATNNDLAYAWSGDGGVTWRRSDGRAYTLPITHATAELVVDTAPNGQGLGNAGGLELDAAGRPHASFLMRGTDGNQWIHVASLTLSGWRVAPAVRFTVGARPLLAAVGMRVFVLHMVPNDGRGPALVVREVTPASAGKTARVWEPAIRGWEASFDTQALYAYSEIHLIAPNPVDRSVLIQDRSSVPAAVLSFRPDELVDAA